MQVFFASQVLDVCQSVFDDFGERRFVRRWQNLVEQIDVAPLALLPGTIIFVKLRAVSGKLRKLTAELRLKDTETMFS